MYADFRKCDFNSKAIRVYLDAFVRMLIGIFSSTHLLVKYKCAFPFRGCFNFLIVFYYWQIYLAGKLSFEADIFTTSE